MKLNPKLWENNKLKNDVEAKLKDIASEFISGLIDEEIPIDVQDIRLVGSNASFNYTPYSDLDIHIIADIDKRNCPDILFKLYNYYKSKFNDNYNITVKDVDVELYIEDSSLPAVSNGMYSLLFNKWLKFPNNKKIPKVNIDRDLEIWVDKYNEVLNGKKDPKQFLNDLYLLRKLSIATQGEYGQGNLIFKDFRNKGFLTIIKDLIRRNKEKELCLENLNVVDTTNEKYYEINEKYLEKVKEPVNMMQVVKLPLNLDSIKSNTFENNKYLKEIDLNENIILIGQNAFTGCHNLEKVISSKKLVDIEAQAFTDCINLKSLDFSNTELRLIKHAAFYNCSNLKTINLGDKLMELEHAAFGACRNLKNIILPPTLKSLNNEVFAECVNLEWVYISKNLESIDTTSFKNCQNIIIYTDAITLPNSWDVREALQKNWVKDIIYDTEI